MKREKIVILPKLASFNNDLKKKWYVYYSVRDPKDGKMRMKKIYKDLDSPKIKDRLRVADALIEEMREKLILGYNPWTDETEVIYADSMHYQQAAKLYKKIRKSNKNFNYFANLYIKHEMLGLEKSTVQTYISKCRTFDGWLMRMKLHDADLKVLTNDVVVEFFRFLIEERQLSSFTYKKYRNLLHAIFEFAFEKRHINFNPVVRLPKNTRKVDNAPAPIQLRDLDILLRRLKQDPQLYLTVLFEYYCFMRPGEIREMKLSWIDWDRGVIRIPSNKIKTKNAKTPIIPDVLMQLLKDEFKLNTYPEDLYVIGKGGEPSTEHYGKNTMRFRFNKIRKDLALPSDYMLYSWKHTGNGMLEQSGANSFERMMQNGHTSIVTTERYTRRKFGFESEHIRKNFPLLEAAGYR